MCMKDLFYKQWILIFRFFPPRSARRGIHWFLEFKKAQVNSVFAAKTHTICCNQGLTIPLTSWGNYIPEKKSDVIFQKVLLAELNLALCELRCIKANSSHSRSACAPEDDLCPFYVWVWLTSEPAVFRRGAATFFFPPSYHSLHLLLGVIRHDSLWRSFIQEKKVENLINWGEKCKNLIGEDANYY